MISTFSSTCLPLMRFISIDWTESITDMKSTTLDCKCLMTERIVGQVSSSNQFHPIEHQHMSDHFPKAFPRQIRKWLVKIFDLFDTKINIDPVLMCLSVNLASVLSRFARRVINTSWETIWKVEKKRANQKDPRLLLDEVRRWRYKTMPKSWSPNVHKKLAPWTHYLTAIPSLV